MSCSVQRCPVLGNKELVNITKYEKQEYRSTTTKRLPCTSKNNKKKKKSSLAGCSGEEPGETTPRCPSLPNKGILNIAKYDKQEYRSTNTRRFVFCSPATPMDSCGKPEVHCGTGPATKYGNVMWDRRVFRGRGDVKPASKFPECGLGPSMKKCFIECFNVAKPRSIPSSAPPVPAFVDRLHPGRNPRLVRSKDYAGNAICHLEALPLEAGAEEGEDGEEGRWLCSLEEIPVMPETPSRAPESNFKDEDVQVVPEELDCDDRLKPVAEAITGKVVEKAVLEILDEEELAVLRDQEALFERIRAEEMERLQRLEEERQRMEDEAGACCTEDDCRFEELCGTGTETTFQTWLDGQATLEVSYRHMACSVLDDMIRNVVGTRQAEYFWGVVSNREMKKKIHSEVETPLSM